MKSTLKFSLLAALMVAAGLAYSQSPRGGGQCDPMMGPGGGMYGHSMGKDRMGKMDPTRMQAMMEKRHAAMKAQLKITPDQEAAWKAFAESGQPKADLMAKRPDPAEMAKLTTPQRIDKMKELQTQRHTAMTAAMDKHAEATKALYAVLTPEQQKLFDATAMQGMRGQRGQGKGQGPGMMMAPKQ